MPSFTVREILPAAARPEPCVPVLAAESYRPELYYFESIALLRRVALVGVSVSLTSGTLRSAFVPSCKAWRSAHHLLLFVTACMQTPFCARAW